MVVLKDKALGPPLAGFRHATTDDIEAQLLREQRARRSLREQIAKLEHECSSIIVNGFPYIAIPPHKRGGGGLPRMLGLAELEQTRDELVGELRELQQRAAAHAERVHRSRLMLEKMKLEPGRYKFVSLPLRDLGEGICGAWEVRPRLGLVGMLAGWWELKLSSGCPLAKGRAAARPSAIAPFGS